MALPSSAVAYRERLDRERLAVLGSVSTAWRGMTSDFESSWLQVQRRVVADITTAQVEMARMADEYVATVVRSTAPRAVAPEYSPAVTAWAGVAGDGRPVETLARGAVIQTKAAVRRGLTAPLALKAGGDWLEKAMATVLSDTHRGVEQMSMHSRRVGRYVRMVTGRSTCGRCVILAGRVYRTAQAFERHPNCFPAGTVVSGPQPEAASRRWYEGELVVLHTASGKKLSATANHPILTDQGWIPANLLNEGDSVIASTAGEGARPLVVPDEQQCPALIEDVWRSGGMVPLGQMPTASEDFHGDGGHGDVDVVLADRLLRHGRVPRGDQVVKEALLAGGVDLGAGLAGLGAPLERVERNLDAADGSVGGLGLLQAFSSGHFPRAGLPGRGHAPHFDSDLFEPPADHIPTHRESLGDGVLRLASDVGTGDVLDVERDLASRWDAPAGSFSVEARAAYASRGKDLGLRLAGQVAADRIVKLERVQWSGHVYNLTSPEGWYSANGLIVSNCDCIHVPASENIAGDILTDPGAYLNSLSDDGLAKALGSKANAQAYRDGADVNQMINAYRRKGAVQKAQDLRITTEGMSRRGWARQSMTAAGLPRSAPRLMPSSIYELANDREDAIRMLRTYGWIL